jgi:creatinine amidohydrolase
MITGRFYTMAILRVEEMTWREMDDLNREETVFLLPLGPLEEHGPHLPLGTDPLTAEGIAERAAQLLEEENPACTYMLLPRLWVGHSEGAMHFCGTLSVGTETLKLLIKDLCISLARHGFRKVLLVNHHMDLFHIRALLQAVVEVNSSYPIRAVDASSAILLTGEEAAEEQESKLHVKEEAEIHADVRETSFMLHRHPRLVRACYRELPPVRIRIAEELRQGHIYFDEMGAAEGYMGSPAQANAALGAEHLESGARAIAGLARKLLHNEDIVQIGPHMERVLRHLPG